MVNYFSVDYIGLYINWANTSLFIILGKLPKATLTWFSYANFQFCSVDQSSYFVDHAGGSSQFCLLDWRGKVLQRIIFYQILNLQILNINKISNYERLLNVTALILRFIINLSCTNVCSNWKIQESWIFMASIYTRCYKNCQF